MHNRLNANIAAQESFIFCFDNSLGRLLIIPIKFFHLLFNSYLLKWCFHKWLELYLRSLVILLRLLVGNVVRQLWLIIMSRVVNRSALLRHYVILWIPNFVVTTDIINRLLFLFNCNKWHIWLCMQTANFRGQFLINVLIVFLLWLQALNHLLLLIQLLLTNILNFDLWFITLFIFLLLHWLLLTFSI